MNFAAQLQILMLELQLPSPLQQLQHSLFDEKQLQVWIKRDDLIHTGISGNKWRKLEYSILAAREGGKRQVLTFGGAFSNHVVATAIACKANGLSSIGMIRGEAHQSLNPTLRQAVEAGMQLKYLDRGLYKQKESPSFLAQLKVRYPDAFIVPEGGANAEGVKGCRKIISEVPFQPDYVLCSAGTGTTAAGLLSEMEEGELIVLPAIKGALGLKQDILTFSKKANVTSKLKMVHDFHFGGYAKVKAELVTFVNRFYADFQIPLDLIYTAKMAYGFWELLKQDYFPPNSKVLLIHTGGLQGNKGMMERYKINLDYT